MNDSNKKIRVLLEMRPALEGFAGIPQEVRLLFRALRLIESVSVEGFLQTSFRRLAMGTRDTGFLGVVWRTLSVARRYKRYSNVIISMTERPHANILELIMNYLMARGEAVALQAKILIGFGTVRLTRFESKSFEDFTWRTLFAKTLSASDFSLVSSANHRVCSVPWNTFHNVGLTSRNWRTIPRYPTVDTRGFDVFIGQPPFPGRVDRNTTMVIRYHDAIPVFMPHTIPDKSLHQSTHFFALMSNVKSGAWFACVSEASRQDVLRMFPQAADRAVTIHNMVSNHYFNEDSAVERVPDIIRARLHEGDASKGISAEPAFFSVREKESFYKRSLYGGKIRYLLIVSTVEPRKNHMRLLAAWEVIRAEIDPTIKLVVVGGLGWDYAQVLRGFRSWIDRGELFMLSSVPAPDLRVLYRHAAATVCPSLGEGFDFSGVEAMRSGGITVASDIPVHREIYEDAAEYFDPYSTMSLVNALRKVLYDPESDLCQHRLRARADEVSARYLPEVLLPQWEAFLKRVTDRA